MESLAGRTAEPVVGPGHDMAVRRGVLQNSWRGCIRLVCCHWGDTSFLPWTRSAAIWGEECRSFHSCVRLTRIPVL